MSLSSVLEAPAPPAEDQRKLNLLIIEPIDLDDVTDDHIQMLEKHLVMLKEKRAERKKRELEESGSIAPPPPPPATPPKKSKWVQATTEEGNVYYYNKETRESTWTLPDESEEQADTTSDRSDARAVFKATVAKHVASILEPIRKVRFATADDYKYVLRKLTHTVLEKELKRIGEGELKVTDSVKEKTKRYVQDYVARLGDGQYSRKNKQHNAY